ncbi:MAG: VCBS repeat-containing protein [Pyrinomonadaceae bacterium]
MYRPIKKMIRDFSLSIFTLSLVSVSSFAAPVVRTASGANPAAIQATVDLFRADLGGANNGVGNSFVSGRREINWDGVPDNFASPNNLPVDFFNANSPRGVVFDTASFANVRVSAISGNPTATPLRFGEIDPSYTALFSQVFSAQRLFGVVKTSTADDTSGLTIEFFIPGTQIPATVSGFGAVFSDVDDANGSGIVCYGTDGKPLGSPVLVPAANGGLSFVGISFNAGERIAKVKIFEGNRLMAPGNIEGVNGNDIVAMDDFIYGEPHARTSHTSDFDADGTTDFAVFRPSNGGWFILNSGTNTFSQTAFGQNGDIPVDGDFDGDSRTDIAVFRPSSGSWFFVKSTTGIFSAVAFGTNGDRPVPGDYDKDGKTDVAVFRPSLGQWFYLRSSDGAFQAIQWGANGDIPLPAAAQ